MGRQLQNATFEKFTRSEAIGTAIRTQAESVSALDADLCSLESDLHERSHQASDPLVEADPAVKRAAAAATAALEKAKEGVAGTRAKLATFKAAIEEEQLSWDREFAAIKAEYDKLVREIGGSQVALDQRRRRAVADLAALERQIADAAVKARVLKPALESRKQILDRLDAAYKAYFRERLDRCEFFTQQAHGAIQVTVAEGRDVSQYRARLLGVKRGSYLKDEDIDHIVRSITPRELIGGVLQFELRGRAEKRSLQDLAAAKGIRPDLLERLANHLLDELGYEGLLSLMYETAPQDVPEIAYQVSGAMKPLAELSVGQKAVALLIVGLSDGRFPIVIDQPEDSLDLRSIWEDVCRTLRDAKEHRQFIFTTHNSSVAVASDSDKFTIMQAGALQAQIVFSGSINSAPVRAEVLAYLEGGPDTYEKKRSKYNVEPRVRD